MAATAPAVPAERSALDRFFKVTEAGSTAMTEIRGGATNFLVMSYILVVNAIILANAGMPFPAVVAATALMAAIFTAGMGLWANYPYAGAAGLGINAVVAFGLVKGAGLSWQGAMGVVVLEGALIHPQVPLALPSGTFWTTVGPAAEAGPTSFYAGHIARTARTRPKQPDSIIAPCGAAKYQPRPSAIARFGPVTATDRNGGSAR